MYKGSIHIIMEVKIAAISLRYSVILHSSIIGITTNTQNHIHVVPIM